MRWNWIFSSFFILFFWLGPGLLPAGEKVVIGEVEDVILLPWKIKIPARIDTGAALSSLDARDLKVEGGFVQFRLSQKLGGISLRLPVVDWLDIRSSEASERRPIVEIDLCISSRKVRTKVNLNDRSKVRYPLLIGRNTLRENFIVDCLRERCAPPSCEEVSSP